MTDSNNQSSEALLPDKIGLTRRNALKIAGAAGAVTGGFGGVGAVSAEETDNQHQMVTPARDSSKMSSTRVDVEEGDEVTGIIEDISDGELLVFPEGEFQWSRSVGVTADNWGIVGQPDDGTVFMTPEGTFPTGYTQHANGRLSDYGLRIGLWTGIGHNGTASVINPVLTGFPADATYTSRTPGTVYIIGGYMANNNVADVRLSGSTTVIGTTMELDTEAYAKGPGKIGGSNGYNTRMVWGDTRNAGTPEGLVMNCSFILQSYDESQGLVDILENPHITILNSQFLLNDEIAAVSAIPAPGAGPSEVALINCGFTGDAPATAGVAGTGDITGINNCVSEPIDPGDIPVNLSKNCSFNWGLVHSLARPDDEDDWNPGDGKPPWTGGENEEDDD